MKRGLDGDGFKGGGDEDFGFGLADDVVGGDTWGEFGEGEAAFGGVLVDDALAGEG